MTSNSPLHLDVSNRFDIPGNERQDVNEKQDTRKLRSNSRSDFQINQSLFQFNLNYEPPDYSKPLQLLYKKVSHSDHLEDTPVSKAQRRHDIVPVIPPADIVATPVTEDLLNDELYNPFHRKKEREEKRQQSIEREKGLAEMEKLTKCLEQVKSPSWRLYIANITQIIDMSDKHEVETKRRWTIDEIESYLEKYTAWKKRNAEIKRQNHELVSKQQQQPALQSSEKEPRQRAKKPRLSTGQEIKEFVSFYKNPSRRTKFDTLLQRKNRPDIWAFGESVPLSERRHFTIPEQWRIDSEPNAGLSDNNGSSV